VDVTPCSQVEVHRHLGGTYSLPLQGRPLKVKVKLSLLGAMEAHRVARG
jgi:hypothetical protein